MEFKLPDIGEGVHEGEVVRWLVKVGDPVGVDQPIVEIMTDKATVEIPSAHAGQVEKLMAKEGEVVKVGQTIMTMGAAAGSAAKTAVSAGSVASANSNSNSNRPVSAPSPASRLMAASPGVPGSRPVSQGYSPGYSGDGELVANISGAYMASPGQVLATPATRRLARDLGVDLTQVPATGPNGRVTKEDVQQFVGATAAGPALPVRSSANTSPNTSLVMPGAMASGALETLVPFRGIRRKISEAMSKSRHTIADFSYVDECEITELVAFRNEAKPLAEKHGVKLTYLPFICKAIIQGLKTYPYLNAVLDEQSGNIILKNYYNLGIAVDTDDGLIVPVVKNAEHKSVLQIAKEIQDLAEKARARKLAIDDVRGGTFTITNAGNIGGMLATPIINWPEVAIFGVHKISRRPIVRKADGKEEIGIGDMIWLSVAVDHRVVDGAMAARFMNVVMEYLSSPKKLMLDMV